MTSTPQVLFLTLVTDVGHCNSMLKENNLKKEVNRVF